MEVAEAVKGRQGKDTVDSLMDKLDEAFDDLESGRARTVDEAWEKLDLLLEV